MRRRIYALAHLDGGELLLIAVDDRQGSLHVQKTVVIEHLCAALYHLDP